MKFKILGWIGIIWGAAVVAGASKQLINGEWPSGSYGTGQWFGVALGLLLVFAGVRALKKAA